jgi:N-acetylmuramoyl-L-alanine amidase
MKFAPVAIAAAVTLALASLVSADSLVIGSQTAPSSAPFLVVGDEILAPLLPELPRLGAQFDRERDKVTITTAQGRKITLMLGAAAATVDGVTTSLPAAPRERDGHIFLPARGLAGLLRLNCQWDPASRTLSLHPRVTAVTWTGLPDRVRISVEGTAPLEYASGELPHPVRRYFDFSGFELLDSERQMVVNEGALQAVRVAQNSTDPSVVRLVLILSDKRAIRSRYSAGNTRLILEVPREDIELPEAPPEPVELQAVTFRRLGKKLAEVDIATSGPALAEASRDPDKDAVVVEIAGAVMQHKLELIPADPLVASVVVQPKPTASQTCQAVIRLKGGAGHAVVSEDRRLRLLLGTFDLSDLTVVVDPGHGGNQSGAIGPSGLMEKDVNLDVGKRLLRLLQAAGARVRMTRTTDAALAPIRSGNLEDLGIELRQRSGLANDMGADLFVSLHCNASNPHSLYGSATYFCTEWSRQFAQTVQQELHTRLGLFDRGVHSARFVVVRTAEMPAVLVEMAYIDWPAEEKLLGEGEFRQKAAEAVFAGLRRYVAEGGLLPHLAKKRDAAEPRTASPPAAGKVYPERSRGDAPAPTTRP